MRRKLRSNLPAGTPVWAGRRAQWRALGLSDADMEKPKIAVVNSSSELSSCFSHLDGVAAEAKKAIRAAGGLPFEIRTAASSDFVTCAGRGGAYILPTRDLIAADIEVQVEGALLDGMLCLASCDKTAPGQIMAAGRLDMPTIVVPCGYQQSGQYRGQHVDIEEVFLKSAYVSSGATTLEEVTAMADVAVRSPGVCAGMGTANSMHIVSEALGMTFPGAAPVAALSPKMMDNVRASGARIVEMVWQDLKPAADPDARVGRQRGDGGARAQRLDQLRQAHPGDRQRGRHRCRRLRASRAVRAEGAAPCRDPAERRGPDRGARGRRRRPRGDEAARAAAAQGGQERFRLHPVQEALQGIKADESVIRPLDRPLSTRPTLNIVRGSLLPGGGIVRIGGVGERKLSHRGPANIFHSREEALEAIKKSQIEKGQVVILRGLGVIGGPGMAMTSAVVFALDGAGIVNDVAVITEGQLSGLVNMGLVVGEASPEAAAGGPIALVEKGDIISIDVKKREVNLEVAPEVLEARRARVGKFGAQNERGWLSVYQRTVQPVHKGAVLSKDE